MRKLALRVVIATCLVALAPQGAGAQAGRAGGVPSAPVTVAPAPPPVAAPAVPAVPPVAVHPVTPPAATGTGALPSLHAPSVAPIITPRPAPHVNTAIGSSRIGAHLGSRGVPSIMTPAVGAHSAAGIHAPAAGRHGGRRHHRIAGGSGVSPEFSAGEFDDAPSLDQGPPGTCGWVWLKRQRHRRFGPVHVYRCW